VTPRLDMLWAFKRRHEEAMQRHEELLRRMEAVDVKRLSAAKLDEHIAELERCLHEAEQMNAEAKALIETGSFLQ